MAEWQQAAQARNAFADMMDGLSEEQQQAASLCDGWRARDVAAHLTFFTETGGFGFISGLVTSGFNFAAFAQKAVDERADRSLADLLSTLRANASKSAPLPGFPESMTVADVTIHTQDVRRPLGLEGAPDPALVRVTLDFLTTNKQAKNLVGLPPLEGVELVAIDSDWSFGEGAEISGPAESLMMALAGRPAIEELSGDGLASWR